MFVEMLQVTDVKVQVELQIFFNFVKSSLKSSNLCLESVQVV